MVRAQPAALGACRSSGAKNLAQVKVELAKGAEANGYPNDLYY